MTRVLMIYPKFIPNSFWNYTEACELVGAKYPAAPLGLITIAAMLPQDWDIRLINRNTEALTDTDLDWADLVMIGGMLNQQPDFIDLYGRVPRTKTHDQILAELQALYDRGYRGHVDFVDDNFIGNRKYVRPLMPRLKAWLQEHDYPFEFTTEASINLADDDDMLQ